MIEEKIALREREKKKLNIVMWKSLTKRDR